MSAPATLAATIAFLCCSTLQGGGQRILHLQAASPFGAIVEWPVEPPLSRSDIQAMRDRAHGFCLAEKPLDVTCVDEQDHSLFEYVRSFALVRLFRNESRPTFPYAAAHKRDPAAFDRVRDYCYSIYSDHGSRDARMLGPCMMSGLGGDFFGVVPVP